jgi:hypothetical protein
MSSRIVVAAIVSLALGCALVFAQPQPSTFFKNRIGLSDGEIQQIGQGQVVTKVLDTGSKYGMLVFGAVYVNAPVPKFAAAYRNVNNLLKDKVYIAVQEFSQGGKPPTLADFARLELPKKDVDEFKNCKPGDCDLQIFSGSAALQAKVNWKSPDRYNQMNQLVREALVQGLTKYLSGGLQALGSYRDRENPLNLYEAMKEMVDRSFYIPKDKMPGIYSHVVDYPKGKMAGADDFFYWQNMDFGEGPTIRVDHVTIFPGTYGPITSIVADKQLYATRYIRLALQMFYCVPDTQNPGKPGFYLIEMNDSQLPDFGGLKLSIVRRVATSKSVEGTNNTLALFKRIVEGN